MRQDANLCPQARRIPGTVGLLKNPIPEKMAIENKRVSMAIFAQMVLFQQPHSPSPALPRGTVPVFRPSAYGRAILRAVTFPAQSVTRTVTVPVAGIVPLAEEWSGSYSIQ